MENDQTTGNSSTSSNSSALSEQETRRRYRRKWMIENAISLMVALLIVFMIRSSIVEAFKIPSGSMIPTLHIGDHIFVNKFAYGLKVPFSDLLSNEPTLIVKRDGPKRGDIVVFRYPKDDSIYYIKRVVGIPGDTVAMRERVLYINDKEVTHQRVQGQSAHDVFKALGNDPKFNPNELELSVEDLDSQKHWIMMNRANHFGDNFAPVSIPPKSYFVMGDNRDYSNDSRWWGFVPEENIKGKAMVIWLSLWLNFTDGQYSFAPSRIGTILHSAPAVQ